MKKKKRLTKNTGDWYDMHIEEPVRELTRVLRDNGVNTECSCGHDMYIQCQYIPDETVFEIHNLVWHYLHDKGVQINFEIIVRHTVVDGHAYSSLDVYLYDDKSCSLDWRGNHVGGAYTKPKKHKEEENES